MNAQEKNKQLIREHNKHRRRLGYTYMRNEWINGSSTKTIQEDNRRLVIMNKIYEKSRNSSEANEKIDKLGI